MVGRGCLKRFWHSNYSSKSNTMETMSLKKQSSRSFEESSWETHIDSESLSPLATSITHHCFAWLCNCFPSFYWDNRYKQLVPSFRHLEITNVISKKWMGNLLIPTCYNSSICTKQNGLHQNKLSINPLINIYTYN